MYWFIAKPEPLLTSRGQETVNERKASFKRYPNDPKFIRCTYTPEDGWDLTLAEAKQFIASLKCIVIETVYSPADTQDVNEYIWIAFE
jgi:hypothetical protein